PQIVGEIVSTGPKSKKVAAEVSRLVATHEPELSILTEIGTDDLRRAGGSLLADAVGRLRRGEVRREAGYDGEYGVVALFGPGELDRADALFDLAIPEQAAAPARASQRAARSAREGVAAAGGAGAARSAAEIARAAQAAGDAVRAAPSAADGAGAARAAGDGEAVAGGTGDAVASAL